MLIILLVISKTFAQKTRDTRTSITPVYTINKKILAIHMPISNVSIERMALLDLWNPPCWLDCMIFLGIVPDVSV